VFEERAHICMCMWACEYASVFVWKYVQLCMLISGRGLAGFAQGEVEGARGSLEGSGMEHAGLSVCLSAGLIKGAAKELSVLLLLPLFCVCVCVCVSMWKCPQLSVSVDVQGFENLRLHFYVFLNILWRVFPTLFDLWPQFYVWNRSQCQTQELLSCYVNLSNAYFVFKNTLNLIKCPEEEEAFLEHIDTTKMYWESQVFFLNCMFSEMSNLHGLFYKWLGTIFVYSLSHLGSWPQSWETALLCGLICNV